MLLSCTPTQYIRWRSASNTHAFTHTPKPSYVNKACLRARCLATVQYSIFLTNTQTSGISGDGVRTRHVQYRECSETAKSYFVNIAVFPFRYDRKNHITRYTTALVHQDSFKPGSSLDTTRRFLGWDIHATDQKQKQRKRACILVLLTNVTNKKQVKTKAE